ncbi:hypothetical protein OIDMADRAFT_109913 [Oidiodendron maius Zn]|uniref:Metallo-beta-lactamase domain-containing protein n=1 Tax=Oidiodendron maius (strain Zn) TaxID=913774 RepID=A0A0C3HV02_OIDMZ|nr:hypothetical protein OIDMADRAFT_109913 [Oidiodendron maius Zn]
MDTSTARRLPRHDVDDDSYIQITPFETGRMVTPCATLVENARGASIATSWRFFLKHLKTNTYFWFDMGISDDLTLYPRLIQNLHTNFKTISSRASIVQDTVSLDVDPSSVKHVIISHAHWDHLHPLPPSFINANMIVGPGSCAHYAPGYPSKSDSKYDGYIWDESLRKFPLRELPPITEEHAWKPLGPFSHTYDFFEDGSFYLINAPGHMEENLAALARVKTKYSKMKWVLLGGDCAHSNIFTYWPNAPFGSMPVKFFPSGTLHECRETARETILRIAECKKNEDRDLFVWYAHGDFLEGLWEL